MYILILAVFSLKLRAEIMRDLAILRVKILYRKQIYLAYVHKLHIIRYNLS
jgi:hypothetical protein